MAIPRILVVGSINQDIIFYGPQGDAMSVNGCLVFDSFDEFQGGKGANQAIAAAKLGAYSSLVGAVGDDPAGKGMIKTLADEGVETTFVSAIKGVKTGLSAIFNMRKGGYVGTNVLGANSLISTAMVENALAAEKFDMVLMQLEMPLETVYGTYSAARKHSIPVVLDAGPAKHIPLERLEGIFMISPNEAEAYALTGIDVADESGVRKAAEYLYEHTSCTYAVMKLGPRGAYLFDGQDGEMFPAVDKPCVDTTGAGDTFTTAMMIKLCEGGSISEAIQYGNAAAALCISKKGGLVSIPSRKETDDLYDQITKEAEL